MDSHCGRHLLDTPVALRSFFLCLFLFPGEMLRHVQSLQDGTLDPLRLKNAVRSELSLHLNEDRYSFRTLPRTGVRSHLRSFTRPEWLNALRPSANQRAVLSMDVDGAEGRYMMCSTHSGFFNLFDTWTDDSPAWQRLKFETPSRSPACPCASRSEAICRS